MIATLRSVCGLVLALGLVGCGQPPAPSIDGTKYVLKAEPAGAKDVLAARKEIKDGNDVVIAGRIGGRQKVMIPGSAVFTLVDLSMTPCPPEEKCPTPWDFCCVPKEDLLAATATVKFESAPGQTITEDPRQLLGVKELDIVVVRGKAKRDGVGNLVVLADGIYVREQHK